MTDEPEYDRPEGIPDEWIVERATPEETAAWLASIDQLPRFERDKPAAEVLAELRGEPYDPDVPYDFTT